MEEVEVAIAVNELGGEGEFGQSYAKRGVGG